MTPRRKRKGAAPLPQRGFALIAMLALAAMITAFLIAIGLNRSNAELTNEREDRNMAALNQAKAALISYAANEQWQDYKAGFPLPAGFYVQPGALPCPDMDDDGDADCIGSTTSSMIGRLPWTTLGVDDLRDSSGERLWYALSWKFRKLQNGSPATIINSDTQGQLNVTGTSPASNVVAVLFTPGLPISGQTRSSNPANPAHNSASNYLEGFDLSDPVNYVFTSNNYVTASSTVTPDTFNDRVMVITQADLMAAVEPAVTARIERDVKHFLTDYAAQWHAFPFPARFDLPTPGTSGSGSTRSPMTLIGDPSQQGGLLPLAYVEVTAATNASPITITTDSAHSLSNGSTVWISNVLGNTAANGRWTISVVDPTHFRLNGSSGSGNYTSGGVVRLGYAWGGASVTKAGGQGRINNDSCTTVNSPVFGLRCTFRAQDEFCGSFDCMSNLSFRIQTNVGQNAGRSFATLPTVADVSFNTIDGNPATFNSPVLTGLLDNTGLGTVSYTATLPISCGPGCMDRQIVVVIPDVAPSSISDTLNDPINNKVLWFLANEWYRQVYYAVAPDLLPGGSGSCPNTKPCLTVSNLSAPNNDKQAILVLAGRTLNGSTRPSANTSDYLEGANQTAVPPTSTYIFEHRAGSPTSINDRVVVIAP